MDNDIPYDFPADDDTEELDPRDIYRPIPKSPELDFPDWDLYEEIDQLAPLESTSTSKDIKTMTSPVSHKT